MTHEPLDPKPQPSDQDMKIVYVLYVLCGLALVGILVANQLGAFGFLRPNSVDSTPATLSPTARCEQAWLDNKDNPNNAGRTRSEYMTNCVDFQKALDQIKRDHG